MKKRLIGLSLAAVLLTGCNEETQDKIDALVMTMQEGKKDNQDKVDTDGSVQTDKGFELEGLGKTFQFISAYNQRCLSQKKLNGIINIASSVCDENDETQFFSLSEDGFLRSKSNDSLCLSGKSISTYTKPSLSVCKDESSFKWTYENNTFRSLDSDKVLDLSRGNLNVYLWDYHGGPNQVWQKKDENFVMQNEAPSFEILSHTNAQEIKQDNLSEVVISLNAVDNDGFVSSLQASAQAQNFRIVTTDKNLYTIYWTPSRFGSHSIKIEVKDNKLKTSSKYLILN